MAGSANIGEASATRAGASGKSDVRQSNVGAESYEGDAGGQLPKDQDRYQGKYYAVQSPARFVAQTEGGSRKTGEAAVSARGGRVLEAEGGEAGILYECEVIGMKINNSAD